MSLSAVYTIIYWTWTNCLSVVIGVFLCVASLATFTLANISNPIFTLADGPRNKVILACVYTYQVFHQNECEVVYIYT